jgi:tripartite-type tricarboxylate transporter receptor subunit TctC
MFTATRRATFAYAVTALVAAAVGLSDAALAQAYPAKPVTLVVPFAAGGPSDVISRLIALKMGEKLGQQIIVENIAGAGGTVAADRVSRNPPDGYTLLVHHIALPLGASLYKNLKYDTATAFDTLGLINTGPYVLTSKAALPPNDYKGLVAHLTNKTNKITMAHAGVGSGSYICSLMLMQAVGFEADLVAYRGTGPALNDVVGGHVDILCDQTTNTFPQIADKKIKAFAITSAARSMQFPDIPTMDEVGLKGLDLAVWHALYAPKGLPADVKAKVTEALEVSLKDPMIAQRFADLGTFLFPEGARGEAAHRAKFDAEMTRMRAIVDKAGIATDAK